MTSPNPVPTPGRQVNYCVPTRTDLEPAAPLAGSQGPVDAIPAPGTPQRPHLETAPPAVAQETHTTGEGVVTQPAPVPVGLNVGGAAEDPWVIQTATISAVNEDVATSGLVTLSVFTNIPEAPIQVITDVPYKKGQFVPGAWNWPNVVGA